MGSWLGLYTAVLVEMLPKTVALGFLVAILVGACYRPNKIDLVNDLSTSIFIDNCAEVDLRVGEKRTFRPRGACSVYSTGSTLGVHYLVDYLGCLYFSEEILATKGTAKASSLDKTMSQKQCANTSNTGRKQ